MTRTLGSSDIKVSTVGVGCNAFGTRIDQEQTTAVVDACFEHGVTFFDTADVYGPRARCSSATRSRDAATRSSSPRSSAWTCRAERRRRWTPGQRCVRTHGDRREPQAARHRPRRSLPVPHAGPEHADRGDARCAERARHRGQGPRDRQLQPAGVAGRRRRLGVEDQGVRVVRDGAERVLALQPHRRDRAGPGLPGARRRHPAVLPAGVRAAHRQVPPRRAGA